MGVPRKMRLTSGHSTERGWRHSGENDAASRMADVACRRGRRGREARFGVQLRISLNAGVESAIGRSGTASNFAAQFWKPTAVLG